MINQDKDNLFLISSLIGAISSYVFLLTILPNYGMSSYSIDNLSRQFLDPHFLKPETFERFAFLLGIFYLPIIALLIYRFLFFIDKRHENLKYDLISSLLYGIIIMVIGFILVENSSWFWKFFFNYFFLRVNIFIFLFLLLWRQISDKMDSLLFYISSMAVVFVASLTQFTTDNLMATNFSINHHFSLIIGAINQVAHGKTVLVDLTSQYGVLYPYLGALFAKVFGFSIFNISLFFVLLIFITYLFIYLTLAINIGYKSWFSFLALLAIIGLTHPFYETMMLDGVYNTYYQYIPLRTIFCSFFAWFSLIYLNKKNQLNYYIGIFGLGISLLWNLDTGVPLLISWVGLLVYETIAEKEGSISEKIKETIRHLIKIILCLILIAHIYVGFAYLRSGYFPDWLKLIEFQSLFYKSGFGMLPMPKFGLWYIPIFIYLAIIVSCLISLYEKKATQKESFYFFLSLLGVGIFSYYQGRSALSNLFPVSFPALIIGSCLANDISRKIQLNKENYKYFWRNKVFYYDFGRLAFIALILNYGLVCIYYNLTNTGYWIKYNIESRAEENSVVKEMINFIDEHKKGAEIVIFSGMADYLYCKTNTYSALPVSSLTEIFAISQVEDINKIIQARQIRQIFTVFDKSKGDPFQTLVLPIIQKYYRPVKQNKNGRMILYEPVALDSSKKPTR